MKPLLNKRLISIGAGMFLLILVSIIAYMFFTRPKTGLITVTAPEAVEISTAKINGVVQEEFVTRGSGDQSFSVPIGEYVLSGESDRHSYKTIVKVLEDEEVVVQFDNYSIETLEAQDSLKAKYFTKAGDNYRYLDNEDGVLYTYFGAQFTPDRFNFKARNISSVFWLDGSSAVALADGQLYRVTEEAFEFLKYPEGQQPELDIQMIVSGYSLSDSDEIFSVINKGLYRYSSVSSEPKLIYELDSFATFAFTSPAGNVALATDSTLSGHRTEEVVNSVVDSNGEVLVDRFSENGVYFVKWSPNNKQFIYSDDVGLWLYSIETNNKKLLIKGSDYSEGSLAWISDSRFIHYDNDKVWEYDIDSGIGNAKYNFINPELLSDFTTPGSISILGDEIILSIDSNSAASPSKIFFISNNN